MRKLKLLTNGYRLCYQKCNRKAYYRFILERTSRTEAMALLMGDNFHRWLDAFWLGKMDPAISLPDPFETARLSAMVAGYSVYWADWMRHVDYIRSEVELAVPLLNPETGAPSTYWQVGVKLDKLARIDGELRIVEHKSTRSLTHQYLTRLKMDSQVSTYDLAVKLHFPNERFGGVLYDVTLKPQQRPLLATPPEKRKYRKIDGKLYENQREADEDPGEYEKRCFTEIAAAPEAYYQHWDVTRLDGEVVEAARNLWFVGAQIRESINQNRWPQNSGACVSEFGSFCEYWPVCSGEAKIEDNTLYKDEPAHCEYSAEFRKEHVE